MVSPNLAEQQLGSQVAGFEDTRGVPTGSPDCASAKVVLGLLCSASLLAHLKSETGKWGAVSREEELMAKHRKPMALKQAAVARVAVGESIAGAI